MEYEMLTVVPAYGRDYKTKTEVLDAWKSGKDFQIQDIGSRWNGAYVSIASKIELLQGGTTQLKVRFKKLASVVVIDL